MQKENVKKVKNAKKVNEEEDLQVNEVQNVKEEDLQVNEENTLNKVNEVQNVKEEEEYLQVNEV